MAYKVTMIITAGTQYANGVAARVGGESDSWYRDVGTLPTGGVDKMKALCTKRATILPKLAAVQGFRYTKIAKTVGASQHVAFYQPGNPAFPTDVPQMSIKIPTGSSNGLNSKQTELRVIPDGQVVNGELVSSQPFTDLLKNYLATLQNDGWCFRGKQLDADTQGIVSIDTLGAFILTDALTFANGDFVTVLRTVNSIKRQKGGTYQVVKDSPTTGTLVGWDHGACKKGKMRVYNIIYPPVTFDPDAYYNSTTMVKKVGRVFNAYRGRRSNKQPA